MRGHKCKSQYFVVLQTEEDIALDTGQDVDKETESDDIPTISLHAMPGHTNPKTLMIMGKIRTMNLLHLLIVALHKILFKRQLSVS